MTIEEARTRVAKGATHLDTVKPGWASRIDVGTLALYDPCGCIVGQLCRTPVDSFIQGLQQLGAPSNVYNASQWGSDHGFDVGVGTREAYSLLQDSWLIAIADRVVKAEPQQDVPAALVGVGV